MDQFENLLDRAAGDSFPCERAVLASKNHRPERSLLLRLGALASKMSAIALANVLEAHSFDMRDWRVLFALYELGSTTQREIVDQTNLDKVAVNRAAMRLKARDLVSVQPHKRDGRSHLLRLTDDARKIVEHCVAELAVLERMALERFTSREYGELSSLHRRLSSSLDELETVLSRGRIS